MRDAVRNGYANSRKNFDGLNRISLDPASMRALASVRGHGVMQGAIAGNSSKGCRTTMKRFAIALVCVVSTGCAQYEQQQFANQQQAHANYVASLQNRCSTYGYQPGTPDFANCMMASDQAAQQADFQQRRAIAAQILLNK